MPAKKPSRQASQEKTDSFVIEFSELELRLIAGVLAAFTFRTPQEKVIAAQAQQKAEQALGS